MEKCLRLELTAEQRGQFRLVLYLLGLWELLVGAALAVLAPIALGHDPGTYLFWGGLVAALSLPMFWAGSHYGREPDEHEGAHPGFRRMD